MSGAPRIKFFRLWERESKNGRRYFAGYIGSLDVVMFKDEQAPPRPGVIAEWQAFASEGRQSPQRPEPDDGGARPQQPQQTSTSPAVPRPARAQRTPGREARKPAARPEPGAGRPFDDDISNLWPGPGDR